LFTHAKTIAQAGSARYYNSSSNLEGSAFQQLWAGQLRVITDSTPIDPNQRPDWHFVVKGNQIFRRHMNAAMGLWPSKRTLVTESMDVNIPSVRVHIGASVESGFEAFQP
jgi:hypothetical protein